MNVQDDSWGRAALCTSLLTFAPGFLGGAIIRMRAGSARDQVLAALASLKPRRFHPSIEDSQLFGGIDLSATLKSGQIVDTIGFFSNYCTAILTMAERCGSELGAKLAQQLDTNSGHCFILLDEGADVDEVPPPALSERLPLFIAPDGRPPSNWQPVPAGTAQIAPAMVTASGADIGLLTRLAGQLGIDSLRAPLLALRVARAHAGFWGRPQLDLADLQCAVQLVFPQRATLLPEDREGTEAPSPPDPLPNDADTDASEQLHLPDGDMRVDAVTTLLPADLLAGFVPAGTSKQAKGAGAGQKRTGNRRGRPLPSRAGRPDGRSKIDFVGTLRAAAPWQPMRKNVTPDHAKLLLRPSDIRLKRYQERSDRLLIFTVDASGSAAVSRLNEAKGAVELLLVQAYAARDHVALISFRGTDAELLLPPTRSLVQTKRRLANLPGGGGTPLAAGMLQAFHLAQQSRSKGLSPTIVILTDGRANIALDGTANRTSAAADSARLARQIAAQTISCLVIDMSIRPQPALGSLAARLNAPYVALPRANARALTCAVAATLGA